MLQQLRQRWKWVLGVGIVGFMLSITLVLAGAAGLAWTSTEEFCIGCHEMRNTVYVEYQGTIHDTNRSGVRAICTDCHVPHEPVALIKRKIEASKELYFKFISPSIDTPEKFEAKRHELATRVWQRMKETDSLECRNCHKVEKMNKELQTAKAQARHAKALTEKMTCIDCHFGIAHKEPDGPGPRELFGTAAKAPVISPQ